MALLRGINVGGKNKVEMARLKAAFESVGCKDVLTYINSGNIIFSDSRPAKDLAKLIQEAIAKEFELDVPVVIRSKYSIEMLIKKIPAGWNNEEQRTEVMFLWDEVDGKQALEHFDINPKIEKLIYLPGALIWNLDRKDYKQGSGPKLIKSNIYKKMTARNINTVRKICILMQQVGSNVR